MMPHFIDLSHTFEDGMPGFRMKKSDGSSIQYTARIQPFLTHEQSQPFYNGEAEFEITEMSFQTSIGTYLDSPYHRWKDRRDISQIALDDVILDGVVIDARGLQAWSVLRPDAFAGIDVRGKAVLICFGWDQHWGTEAYYEYPYLGSTAIAHLVDAGAKLVGVDTINVDTTRDVTRPAHSIFLKRDILIVENLANLDALFGNDFRFFAVPIKAKAAAAMPVRAFAEIA